MTASTHVVTAIWDAMGGEVLRRDCSCGETWTRDEETCPEDDSADFPSEDPADGPPTPWVDHVVALAAEHEHLPSLLTDPVDALSVDGHWQLYPWALRLDVASMLAWAAQFDGGLTAAAVTLRSIPGGAAVTVSGRYADTPTDLIGMTHRHDGGPGPRTVDALRELAQHELAALGRTLDDLRLDLAQATDPLNTLGSVTA